MRLFSQALYCAINFNYSMKRFKSQDLFDTFEGKYRFISNFRRRVGRCLTVDDNRSHLQVKARLKWHE